MPPTHDLESIDRRLRSAGQEHLLRFHDELPPVRRRALLERIARLDLERIPALVEAYVRSKPSFDAPADQLRPAPYYPLDADSPDSPRPWDRGAYKSKGESLLRAGKVAAFTVAGGQGTRLGYDGPKGCYPGSAVTGKPLFRCLAEWIVSAQSRYKAVIPWYIMTSPANHRQTVAFFEDQNWFGLSPEHVMHFEQGEMPSFDLATGKVLLAEKDAPATSPDGHGGSLRALHLSGAIDDMRARGVQHFSYVQIDNPIVRVIDPVFLGLHAFAPDSSGEMSSKMVAKAEPGEKVGVFATAGGKVRVVEYSDLPRELAEARDERGGLRFNAGSPAIHVIGVEFVARLNAAAGATGATLPFHRAEKKVPFVDLETGAAVNPDKPNAVKLEMFVFDALPECRGSIVLETDRVEEFAPIKNADGADSPATSRRVQTRRAARWLEKAGVEAPLGADGEPDCALEISPVTAMWPEDLRGFPRLPRAIERGAEIAL